ncbi:MAG: serine/threonine-protein kinase [Pyrinomonadaceae bacterium]
MLQCPTCGRRYSSDFAKCPEDHSPLQADSTNAGSAPTDPLLGHTLDDKYRLDAQLGIGGMGTVYRARHLLIDRPVAVKVLNPRFFEDEAARTRFQREARAAGRLQHTNAVTVTDYGQTQDGYVYIVMELLEGRTLRDILAKEAPLDAARSVSIMLQISAAVAAAHDAGIIHRDLKPANIFIVQRAEVPALVKVLDFGIAKLAAESLEEDDIKALTQVGAMIGTPRYMSPEQCDGAELTPAADVYSLGVILYEMLTGTVPFSGTTPLAIAMKHTSELPRRPRDFVATIPPALEGVVLSALEKRPEDRPANAAEFREKLLATAERLGLEHAAITSSPNIEALRSVGKESPSGRLVIDISKLRESRAASSDATEITVVSPSVMAAAGIPPVAAAAAAQSNNHSFSRLSVSFTKRSTNELLMIAGAVAVVLVLTIVLVAVKSRSSVPDAAAVPSPSASPTAEPSPSPVVSPSPSTSPSPRRRPAAANRNSNSKGNSVMKKLRKVFRNPF